MRGSVMQKLILKPLFLLSGRHGLPFVHSNWWKSLLGGWGIRQSPLFSRKHCWQEYPAWSIAMRFCDRAGVVGQSTSGARHSRRIRIGESPIEISLICKSNKSLGQRRKTLSSFNSLDSKGSLVYFEKTLSENSEDFSKVYHTISEYLFQSMNFLSRKTVQL